METRTTQDPMLPRRESQTAVQPTIPPTGGPPAPEEVEQAMRESGNLPPGPYLDLLQRDYQRDFSVFARHACPHVNPFQLYGIAWMAGWVAKVESLRAKSAATAADLQKIDHTG